MGILTLKRNIFHLAVCFLVALIFSISVLHGQESSRSAQYYVFLGSDKELQMNVQIWGQTLRPGMYSVPQTTDLVGLISFAGGPTQYANLSNIRVVRTNPKPGVLKVNLKAYINTGNPKTQPILNPGDTVIVPSGLLYGFERFVRVVAELAIIANVYHLFFVRR